MVALPRLAAPPRRHRRQRQVLAEQVPAQAGQEGQHRRRLEHAAAERVGHGDAAGPHRLDQAGDAERRVAAQLQRIAEAVVHAAEHDVDRLQALDRLQEDGLVADGQVAAFDEHEAEIAGQIGVLEVGLVEGARREQHDARRVGRSRRQRRGASRAGRGRTAPAAGRDSRGRPPAGCATARSGSRGRSRRRTAPGCDRPAPTIAPSGVRARSAACRCRCRPPITGRP